MAFDSTTRNRLRSLVSDVRRLLAGDLSERDDAPLAGDYAEQCRARFGLRDDGTAVGLDELAHLTPDERETARKLRARLDHLAAAHPDGVDAPAARPEAFRRLVREEAFTTLNRFAAFRLAEERGLIVQTVGAGMRSAGFQVFERVVNGALGAQYESYRAFLAAVGDELALDLGGLFDRFSPTALLFPSETALDALLALLAAPDLAHVWKADETIGWIYQFFNTREEIRQMRDAGKSGPRNPREMAVRNQFFTPRYVVELLVDNTLGRLWMEMTGGESRLAEALPAYEAHAETLAGREKKDPRTLRLLDPACGSMHFGLYAYDVFEKIYEEAWHDHPDLFADLREQGLSDEGFRRMVPRFILEHNLYGVDIDPRAAQVAGLALWLRAQRAWKEGGVAPENRPRIEKVNVVVAEAMPGEADLFERFVGSFRGTEANARLLGELVTRVWETMQIAGDAGTLLKVEKEIADAVKAAEREWKKSQGEIQGLEGQQMALGAEVAKPVQGALQFSVEGVSRSFFRDAEQRILQKLRAFAEEGEADGAYRRRLFAGDAARGFALVDLLQNRYDVVVMNPPFGDPSVPSKAYLEKTYLDTKGDVFKAFVERACDLLVPGGYVGCISSRTGFFLSSAEAWRTRIVLGEYRPLLLADLGMGVLDAMVETAAYVLRALTEEEEARRTAALLTDLVKVDLNKQDAFSANKYAKVRDLKKHQAEAELERLAAAGFVWAGEKNYTLRRDRVRKALNRTEVPAPVELLCLRLLGEADKDVALHEALRSEDDPRRFRVNPDSFDDVPGSPFAYWVSDNVRRLFKELPPFESDGRTARVGLQTSDDFRFVRLWWEVPAGEIAPSEAHPKEWNGPYCVKEGRWFPFAKGGSYSPYYADLHLVVNWERDGAEVHNFVDPRTGKTYSRPQNTDYYFRPGLTWPRRSQIGLSVRTMPAGSVFADKGPAAFPFPEELAATLGILNTKALQTLVGFVIAFGSYEVGALSRLPLPDLVEEAAFGQLALSASEAKRSQAQSEESAHPFSLPALLVAEGSNFDERLSGIGATSTGQATLLNELQQQIDEAAFDLYGFTEADRRAVALLSGTSETEDDEQAEEEEDGADEEAPEAQDAAAHAHALISYALGVALGRWDVRYATGEKTPPPLPDPFAPLPRVSPGMLVGPDGLPAATLPEGYPVSFPEDGLLVQESDRPGTLVPRVREVFRLLFGDRADRFEAEAVELLGAPSLGDLFSRPNLFFERHLKQYSKSRRKAPIYLPLRSDRSDAYTLWLYVPRLTPQTLYTALQDHVEPRLKDAEADLDRLRDAPARTRADAEDLVLALRDLVEELRRIVALPYRPDLNDGTVLAAAPLAPLVPHRAFRRELESRWKDLEKGKYDWACMAMSLWPDRVRKKCESDKSLAIAHGLA